LLAGLTLVPACKPQAAKPGGSTDTRGGADVAVPSRADETNDGGGRKIALLVGVREYDHAGLPPLRFTENDVEEVARVLQTPQAGFSRVTVLTSTRGQKNQRARPTRANFLAQLKAALDRAKRKDLILVGLAGHGLQARVERDGERKDESFFCPSDARPNDPNTLVSLTDLFRQLEQSGAGVRLMLVDACRNETGVRKETAGRLLVGGTAALFSCKTGQVAYETDKLGKGHGVFFHHVVQGLQGKAQNARGEVTWGRLAEYVVEGVSESVPKVIGGGARQTPQELKNLEGVSPALVAYPPDRKPDTPASEPIRVGQLWDGEFDQRSKKFGSYRGNVKIFILSADENAFEGYWIGEAGGKAVWLTVKGKLTRAGNDKWKFTAKMLDEADNLFSTVDDGTIQGGRMQGKWEFKNPNEAVGTLDLRWAAPAQTKHGIRKGQVWEGKGTHRDNGAPFTYRVRMLVLSADDHSVEAWWLDDRAKNFIGGSKGSIKARLEPGRNAAWQYRHTGYLDGKDIARADGTLQKGGLQATYVNPDRANSRGEFELTPKK
jgi:hypothetical protein